MSRSYRKPYEKNSSSVALKTIHARTMRRRARKLLQVCKKQFEINARWPWEDHWEYPEMPHPRSGVNQYDVCDHRWYIPEEKTAYRK